MMKALALLAGLAALAQGAPPDMNYSVAKVDKLPAVDGKADDAAWAKAAELVVKIDKIDDFEKPKNKCILKAVHDGDSICFLLVWEDKTKNDTHGTFVWKDAKGEYEADENDVEDAASLAFALEGKFNPDMFAPNPSKWDVWEWQAFRANAGHAKDRHHVYSKERIEKSKKFKARDDSDIFITRLDDEGTPPAKKVEAPTEKKGDRVPGFVLQAPSGSGADVAAKGMHDGTKWTVEFKRKLKTGNADDAVFDVTRTMDCAVAVFDNAEKREHEVSGKIILKFQ